jgi:3-dehydroquinate synthase
MDCLNYPIYIYDDFSNLNEAVKLAELTNRKCCIITDENVEELYLNEVQAQIKAVTSEQYIFVFKPGEAQKSLATISEIYDCFLKAKLDRRSFVIALGGGVAGDMAGFAAATFMRGIPFIQLPTSLLAQVDSSVGGKTGVDYKGHKNLIGAFHQPRFVYINLSTLRSLPKTEFNSGMGEVIKHGLIADISYANFLWENREAIQSLEFFAIRRVVEVSCRIKAEIVSQDEKESGLREILNFGHTFGHAIESLSDFKLLHGQCVCLGMCAALYISYKRGAISLNELDRAKGLIAFFGHSTHGFDAEEIYSQMLFDKKVKDGSINLVLLSRIGCAYTERSIGKAEILEAIATIS